MQFTQKRHDVSHTFTFHERHVNCFYTDRSGTGQIDLDYAQIPKESIERVDDTPWMSSVGYVLILMGLLGSVTALPWLVVVLVGAGFVVARQMRKVVYTVLQSGHGAVWILHDRLHDEILHELMSRRKEQLLQLYGAIDLENDLQSEARKFRWLCEEEVLTREEADEKIAQLRIEKQLQWRNPPPEGRPN